MIATGWGLALYDSGNDLQTFFEISAASRCNVVQQVCQSRVKTRNMLAHIRFATRGEVLLMNVHPFRREMVSLLNRISASFCSSGRTAVGCFFAQRLYEVDDETHVYALTSSLILSLYTYVRKKTCSKTNFLVSFASASSIPHSVNLRYALRTPSSKSFTVGTCFLLRAQWRHSSLL